MIVNLSKKNLSVVAGDEFLFSKLEKICGEYLFEFDTIKNRLEAENRIELFISSYISSKREDKINKILE